MSFAKFEDEFKNPGDYLASIFPYRESSGDDGDDYEDTQTQTQTQTRTQTRKSKKQLKKSKKKYSEDEDDDYKNEAFDDELLLERDEKKHSDKEFER